MAKPKHYPFHYEVRFKFIGLEKDGEIRFENFTKVFDKEDPLENRKAAFEVFDEYLSFLAQNGRLYKDSKGNYEIKAVDELEYAKTQWEKEFEESSEPGDLFEKFNSDWQYYENIEKYTETLKLYLVVDEPEILKNIDHFSDSDTISETEFEIHQVSSYSTEPQDFLDNMDMVEVPLYRYLRIDIDHLVKTVYHYGLDYGESGEDEDDGARRVILPTPFIWNTMEDYNQLIAEAEEVNTQEENQHRRELTYRDIIERGEGNYIEFKSSLLYNFKTRAPGIGIKYIIAKAICGYLNSNGGFIFIGVRDNGEIQGLENYDYLLFQDSNPADKLLLELDALISHFLGKSIYPFISSEITNIEGKDVLVIVVNPSPRPVFLLNEDKRKDIVYKEFYIRMNASTRQLTDIQEIIEYIFNKHIA